MSINLSCTTPMCDDGQSSIAQMRSTFDALTQRTEFDQSRYRPVVENLERQFSQAVSWYSSYIPFNETCCTAADIGKQADLTTNEMLASVGEAPVNGPSTRSDMSLPFLIGLGLVAAIFIYAPRRS